MIRELIERYPALEVCREQIKVAADMMEGVCRADGTMMFCGNGGSCADCDHIVGELMKGFLSLRTADNGIKTAMNEKFGTEGEKIADKLQRGIRAISLAAHAGVMTAFANDVDAELIYAQMVYAYAKGGDLVFGISTSGNSKNVIAALKTASAMGLKTIGLTGSGSCKMDEICDVVIKAPATETFKVQEYHLPIYHCLCAELEKRMFG